MRILISFLNIVLICLYFVNLIINHEFGFNFYFGVIVIIAAFLTVFNFFESNYNTKNIPSRDLKIFKLINYFSYMSIVLCIILYFSIENIDQKYNVIFYIYSINILMFGYIGIHTVSCVNIPKEGN